MTVSSLAKKLVGVNDIVIENVELEATSAGEQIVIRARPRKKRPVPVRYLWSEMPPLRPRERSAKMASTGFGCRNNDFH